MIKGHRNNRYGILENRISLLLPAFYNHRMLLAQGKIIVLITASMHEADQ